MASDHRLQELLSSQQHAIDQLQSRLNTLEMDMPSNAEHLSLNSPSPRAKSRQQQSTVSAAFEVDENVDDSDLESEFRRQLPNIGNADSISTAAVASPRSTGVGDSGDASLDALQVKLKQFAQREDEHRATLRRLQSEMETTQDVSAVINELGLSSPGRPLPDIASGGATPARVAIPEVDDDAIDAMPSASAPSPLQHFEVVDRVAAATQDAAERQAREAYWSAQLTQVVMFCVPQLDPSQLHLTRLSVLPSSIPVC